MYVCSMIKLPNSQRNSENELSKIESIAPEEDVDAPDDLVFQSFAEAAPWAHGSNQKWKILLHGREEASGERTGCG